MSIDYEPQWIINNKLWFLGIKHNVKCIVTTDSHYLYPTDQKVHEAILLLQSKKTYKIDDNSEEPIEEGLLESENEKLWEFTVKDLYLKTYDNVLEDWKRGKWFGPDTSFDLTAFSETMENTLKLVDKIENFDIDTSLKIPKLYDNEAEVLRKKWTEGYNRKTLNDPDKIYWNRLQKEHDIIVQMDFVSYFLILEDLISWVRKTYGRETVGPGRGSAGGSLINYCLDITDIDPIKHNLLFERFVDIGRKDLPDVDMDFEPRIRDDVKQYLIDKYGSDKVVSIGNYQLAKVKGAIKDAARIYNVDFAEVNKLTNSLPISDYIDGDKEFIDHLTYEQLLEKYPKLEEFFKRHPDVNTLFKRLRNSIRSIGKHAAGVVVSSVPLDDWIPLMKSKDYIITANTEGGDFHELTAQGLVKFDILGLNNLQVVNDAVKLIKERYNIDIDWNKIDINDSTAYALARSGDTAGVFQFESHLATKTCINVKPDCFSDLSAINSIIRPGPLNMEMDKWFAARKKTGKFDAHPSYAHVLEDTYGILVFQEQFMRLFSEIGGFDVAEVNKARKDITKKESSKKAEDERFKRIRSFKKKFVKNASSKMHVKHAFKLWRLIESFGKYGFNKSHSDAYTYTSFRELWLKAHYGLEFYCSLLNNTEKGKEDKYGISIMAKYISHISTNDIYYQLGNEIKKRNKASILPIDVNKSDVEFTIEGDNIRFGLGSIKGISEDSAKSITKLRPFKNIDDFIGSTEKELKNKRVIVALIKSGALDSISEEKSRSDLYNYLVEKRKYKEDPVGWNMQDIIENEKEFTNISFTEINYFLRLSTAIKQKFEGKLRINALEESSDIIGDNSISCLFRITNVDKKKTEKGKNYYVLNLTDGVYSLGRVYYWAAREKEPINCKEKTISEDVFYGTITKQNNFYNLKNVKFVRKISS